MLLNSSSEDLHAALDSQVGRSVSIANVTSPVVSFVTLNRDMVVVPGLWQLVFDGFFC